jgi:hypothetical protein
MGLFFTILYLLYMIASPATWIPELALVPMQVILSILAVMATVPRLLNGTLVYRSPQVILMALFFLTLVASPLLQGWAGGVLLAFREQLPYAIVLLLVRANCSTLRRRRILVGAFTLLVTVIAVVAIYNFNTSRSDPDNQFVLQQHEGTDEEGVRSSVYRMKAAGLLDDPNDLAQTLLVSIMLMTMLWRDNKFYNFVRVIVPVGICVAGIYFTHSRGALVALAVTLAMAFRRRLKLWGSFILALLLAAGLVAARFTAGRQISMQGGADRLEIWSDGLYLLKHSLFLGVGYRNFGDEVGITAHNSILLVAAEAGIIGLLFFVGAFVISYGQISRLRDKMLLPPALNGYVVAARERIIDLVSFRELRAYELAMTAYLATSWFLSRAYHPLPYMLVALVAAASADHGLTHTDWEITPPLVRWAGLSAVVSVGAIALIYLMVRLRAV